MCVSCATDATHGAINVPPLLAWRGSPGTHGATPGWAASRFRLGSALSGRMETKPQSVHLPPMRGCARAEWTHHHTTVTAVLGNWYRPDHHKALLHCTVRYAFVSERVFVGGSGMRGASRQPWTFPLHRWSSGRPHRCVRFGEICLHQIIR